VAQALYDETPESLAARAQAQQARADGVEPGLSRREGRPTGRERRQMAQWQRWSASLDG
jgi:ribosome-associated heat shock protein Hsp15